MAKGKKERTGEKGPSKPLAVVLLILVVIAFALSFKLNGVWTSDESVSEMMKDAVLHTTGKISLFGLVTVNPGFITALITSAVLIIIAILIRVILIPRFTYVPGKAQSIIEAWVGFFRNLAKTNSPDCNVVLGGYIFTLGSFIFISTLLELVGIQVVNVEGVSMSLPAALSDINGDICVGCSAYVIMLVAGAIKNRGAGVLKLVKDFSLPISMSFRLFGALLSGVLVTELVYKIISLSIVLPVVVGVLFTALHALIQTYVFCMLVTFFTGEATEQHPAKPKKKKEKKNKKISENNAMQEVG